MINSSSSNTMFLIGNLDYYISNVILVSAPVHIIAFGFFRLGQDLGPFGTEDWGIGLRLDY